MVPLFSCYCSCSRVPRYTSSTPPQHAVQLSPPPQHPLQLLIMVPTADLGSKNTSSNQKTNFLTLHLKVVRLHPARIQVVRPSRRRLPPARPRMRIRERPECDRNKGITIKNQSLERESAQRSPSQWHPPCLNRLFQHSSKTVFPKSCALVYGVGLPV